MSDNKKPCEVLVLIGGNGSNLQALIDNQNQVFKVAGVISHRPDVFGLERAKQNHIKTDVVDHKSFTNRVAFEEQLANTIDKYDADLIVLAGFMRVLSPEFVSKYKAKLINIHPSLLPKYKGLNTHQRVIDNNEIHHGTSVHFVTADLDGGPIVAQAKIALGNDNEASSLQKRIQKAEHWLYPKVVNWYCEGRLSLTDNIVLLDNQPVPQTGISFTFDEKEGIAN